MKTYDVTVRRDGRWWMIAIPELGGLTQARRLDEVERAAREFVAVTTDVPLSKVAVEVSGIEADGQDLLEAKTLVDALRGRAKDLEALVGELTREVASALTDANVPVRDVSSVLGVSHQRVSQLVQAGVEGKEAASGKAMQRSRQEFAHDLAIRMDNGRVLQLVEVVPPKTARSDKPRTGEAAQESDHPTRKGARSQGAKRGSGAANPPTSRNQSV
ncbi:hypothetical protein [Kribbella kalugense]|uniref:Uncharacterized protein n=1 Tax=Kribbella kalugense TaxID=2512221 RepID=A0A4R7Z9Q3_9ACTN|nr:hypothetical protein [Kribbella kalugense]TDW14173.1 hypothetical protein EV650_7756 [Kribbella kalugense]